MDAGEEHRALSGQQLHERHERFTSHEKTNAVLRVLKGESLQTVSEDLGVSLPRLERWRNNFVTAGSAELAERKDLPSPGWLAKHSAPIRQWIWLLLTLIAVTVILALFMQRGGG
jgi:hypothetical protein